MINKKCILICLVLFIITTLAMSSLNVFKVNIQKNDSMANLSETPNHIKTFYPKVSDSEPPWWNLTYHYRKPIIITEPGLINRENEPVEVEVDFDSLKAHKNSLRLLYFDGNKWIGPLPLQLSETYLDPDNPNYIRSTKITFLANVSKGKEIIYYLYYTDYPVEEKTYPTDLHVNDTMISNSYFIWWINPPKMFIYPNETGTDWNTVDDGWVGYYAWYGSYLTDSANVELLANETVETGPVYAKVLYRYEVVVYHSYTNIYTIYFTIYAKNPLVKVEFDIDIASYRDCGFWGTVMDIEGTTGDDYYVFYESTIKPDSLDNRETRCRDEDSLKDIRGWTWASIYGTKYGIGIISHKDYTDNYRALIVSRGVDIGSPVYGHSFIFAYINNPNNYGVYWYYFYSRPLIGDAWIPVNDTAVTIAYPLSEKTDIGFEEEAYYGLKIRVEDRVGRVVESAGVIVYDTNNPSIVFNESFTSSNGETLIRFYYNTSLSVGIKVNYTDAGIYVENNTLSADLDIDDVRFDISLTVILNLVDLYITVRSLDGKNITGTSVKIFNSSYLYSPISSVTNSSGVVYFQRIKGGVLWLINATYSAVSGFKVKNDTTYVFTDQNINVLLVKLPISDLRITAMDVLNKTVNEYTVFLYYENNVWDQQTTDDGVVIFYELPAENFTLKFKYLSRPEYGSELSPTVVNVQYPSNRNIVVRLPLAYMHVVVVDVNNESIPGADVIIKGDYTYYGISDESGMVNFTRILFDTVWDIQVSLVTFEGQGGLISVSMKDIWLNVSEMYIFAELPVTDMVIHVLTEQQYNMTDYWKYGVGGAVVYANITGEIVLVSNATDAAGYAIAKFVPVGRYNVTVYFLEQSWSGVFDVYNNSAIHFVLPFKYAQITTRITAISPTYPFINVIWTENITVELTFFVVETNTLIAYGWINWSLVDLKGNTVLSGFGSYDEEQEIYIVSFNSSEVPAGRYTLKIYGGKETYPLPTTEVVIGIEISEIPTELIFEKETIKESVGSDYVSIRVFYKDTFHNSSIVNANVTLIFENQSYRMIPDEKKPGWYVYDFPMGNLSMGVYEIKIRAEKVNYETAERTIGLKITEPEIFGVPRSLFIALLVGLGTPIAGMFGFTAYRYFRVPKVLRILNKIISKVEKGERISLDTVADVRSRRDIISEEVSKLWKNLGIKFGGVQEEGKESG